MWFGASPFMASAYTTGRVGSLRLHRKYAYLLTYLQLQSIKAGWNDIPPDIEHTVNPEFSHAVQELCPIVLGSWSCDCPHNNIVCTNGVKKVYGRPRVIYNEVIFEPSTRATACISFHQLPPSFVYPNTCTSDSTAVISPIDYDLCVILDSMI